MRLLCFFILVVSVLVSCSFRLRNNNKYKIAIRTMPYADYKMEKMSEARIKRYLPFLYQGDTVLSKVTRDTFIFKWQKNGNVVVFNFFNSSCFELIELDRAWKVVKYDDLICENY
jgi:hypothetical protein